jgi:hypothetical protein
MQARIRTFVVASATLMAVAIAAATANNQQAAHAVVESFRLSRGQGRSGVTLQLLLDARFTAAARHELWGNGGWSFVLSPTSALHQQLTAVPPAHGRLVLTSGSGKTLAARDLEEVLATLESWSRSDADAGNRLFLVTEDFSREAGSYNGLRTTLLQVSDSSLDDVRALNLTSQQEQPIRLWKTLKASWQIARTGDGHAEILSVSCHPNPDDKDKDVHFVIDYTRYRLDGSRWVASRRQVDGFWESDGEFPDRSEFR